MCFYFSLHSLPPDLPDDPEEPREVRATDTPEHIRSTCSAAQCYLETVTNTNITLCATYSAFVKFERHRWRVG